ncbi:RICIN domain-containing protein [Streptomyces coelicoflavus]|uniref:RICIN domain-containing protein n=1 Tax=Streptomyces coelicoflavus TaxID=285562 RepID=UPI003800112B
MPEQHEAAGAGSAQGEAQGEARAEAQGEAAGTPVGGDAASGTASRTAGADTSAGTSTARPRTGSTAVVSSSGPDSTGEVPQGTASGAAGAAPASAAADTGAAAASGSARRGRWRALALAGGSGVGRTEGAAATAAPGADGGPPDSGEDTRGGPKKPVLAGAAMVGAILIAVPLLIVATGGDKDEKDDKVANAGSSDTLLDSGDVPPGAFVAQSPSPGRAEKKKADEAPGEKQNPPQKEVAPTPGTSESTPGTTATKSRRSTTTPQKRTAQRKVAPQQPSHSVPSVLTRVLIKNNTNANCVDLPGLEGGKRDGRVVQSTCNSTSDDNQLWNLEKRYAGGGPGGAPLFQIRNIKDGMCLDLPGYGAAGGGTKVTEYPCNGTTGDNQLWWLDQQPDGKFWIRNAASDNQCLDSYSANAATRDLIIWPCAPESANNHEWFTTPH